VIVFLYINLIVAGLVLGYQKFPALVRVGKSLSCLTLLLFNLDIFYSDAYGRLNYFGKTSVVWKWLPIVVSVGTLAVCLLIIWKPFDGKKLRLTTSSIAVAAVLLTVITSLIGSYNKSIYENFAGFVTWPAHLALAIVAFIV